MPVNPQHDVNLLIYYRNRKLKSLFIRNKVYQSDANSRVVYQYSCSEVGCNSTSFIGYTICSLAKRFYTHVQTGAIRLHNKLTHNKKPLTRDLLKDTVVLYRAPTKLDLTIAEALLIKEVKPCLNQQDEGQVRILRIF
jgi:hypothetical protein